MTQSQPLAYSSITKFVETIKKYVKQNHSIYPISANQYFEGKDSFNNKYKQLCIKPIFIELIGFKSKDKVKVLKLVNPNLKEEKGKIPSSFPLKQNIKHYQLHKVAERNTWMIDLMFCGKLTYLIAINVNTKYLFVELLNDVLGENEFSKGTTKSTVSYLRALNKMIEKGMNVKHLTGDGEGSFNSKLAWESFYNSRGIDFKPVVRQVMGNYPDFM